MIILLSSSIACDQKWIDFEWNFDAHSELHSTINCAVWFSFPPFFFQCHGHGDTTSGHWPFYWFLLKNFAFLSFWLVSFRFENSTSRVITADSICALPFYVIHILPVTKCWWTFTLELSFCAYFSGLLVICWRTTFVYSSTANKFSETWLFRVNGNR